MFNTVRIVRGSTDSKRNKTSSHHLDSLGLPASPLSIRMKILKQDRFDLLADLIDPANFVLNNDSLAGLELCKIQRHP